MVQAPDVLQGADVLVQGVIAPGDMEQETEKEGRHGDGVRTWGTVSLSS